MTWKTSGWLLPCVLVAGCATHVTARPEFVPRADGPTKLVLVHVVVFLDNFDDIKWSRKLLDTANQANLIVKTKDGAEVSAPVIGDGYLSLELPPGSYEISRLAKVRLHDKDVSRMAFSHPLPFTVQADDEVVYAGTLITSFRRQYAYLGGPVVGIELEDDITENCFEFDTTWYRSKLTQIPWPTMKTRNAATSASRVCAVDERRARKAAESRVLERGSLEQPSTPSS
jgi:hypothetical protein